MKSLRVLSLVAGLSVCGSMFGSVVGSVAHAQLVTFEEMLSVYKADLVETGYLERGQNLESQALKSATESFSRNSELLVGLSENKIKEIEAVLADHKANFDPRMTYPPTRNLYELGGRFRLQSRMLVDAQIERLGLIGKSVFKIKYPKPYDGRGPIEYDVDVKAAKFETKRGERILVLKPKGDKEVYFVARARGGRVVLEETYVRDSVLREQKSRSGDLPRHEVERAHQALNISINPKDGSIGVSKESIIWYSYNLGRPVISKGKINNLSCSGIF